MNVLVQNKFWNIKIIFVMFAIESFFQTFFCSEFLSYFILFHILWYFLYITLFFFFAISLSVFQFCTLYTKIYIETIINSEVDKSNNYQLN